MFVDQNIATPTAPVRIKSATAGAWSWSKWNSALTRHTAMVRAFFGLTAAACDAAAIIASALVSGWIYHGLFYEQAGMFEAFLRLGFAIAALFVIPNVMREDYDSKLYLTFSGHVQRSFTMWNVAFISSLLLAFMAKATSDVSRGTVFLFYVSGFAAVSYVGNWVTV